MSSELRITGGAGPYEAAAIAAVVDAVLAEEAASLAMPVMPPEPSQWVVSGRPRVVVGAKSTPHRLSVPDDSESRNL